MFSILPMSLRCLRDERRDKEDRESRWLETELASELMAGVEEADKEFGNNCSGATGGKGKSGKS